MRGHLISTGYRCWVGAVANRVYQMVAVGRGPVPRHAYKPRLPDGGRRARACPSPSLTL